MWITEQILFQIARLMYRTQVAHSSEMKSALRNMDAYDAYRAAQTNRVLGAVERHGIPIVGKTVADIGCNDGPISAEYLRHGVARVVGVDIDEEAIRRAQELHRDERLTFVQSTVDSIPLDDQSVDSVISFSVFEHVSEPRAILKELYRILVPGGKALIGTWSWRHPFAPHLWSVMAVPWAHVFFSERTVLRTCRRVYRSSWYVPNMHDYDQTGMKIADKYTHESISADYLNKYLISDFERAFPEAGFACKTHLVPFGSWYARWTRTCLRVPRLREFLAGYVWFELTKPDN